MVAAAGALEMTGGRRAELERLARSHTAPARDVRQAKALLWAADGVSNAEIARRCASTPKSVRRWRSRFAAEGTAAVGRIRAGRGRPVALGDDVVEAIVHDTLHTVPEDGSACWSTRSMAARYGVGKDTVARIWQARRIRPWKVETFKLSTDPGFESKLRDVVGLYVNPPAAAAVFCFDEKTQVQALDRTQPSLPMAPGRAGTMTHDYKRNGTLDLFAALNVGSGEVLHDTRRSHTGRDVLAFFRWIDMHVDPDLELHVILDNLPARKSQPVRDWLAHKKRRRWHLHFTPTSSSWLNLVECWFSALSRKALTNTSFTSVAELETRIDCWVSHWNDNPEPFVWTRTADEILDKVARGQATLDRITKSATHH
jgi:transposase